VKTRITAILAGVAFLHLLLISIITVSGGCKSPDALKPRRYVTDPRGAGQPAAVAPKEEVIAEETIVIEEPVKPAVTETATPAETVVSVEEKLMTYKVENGDSLWKIARKFGVGTGELAAQNKLNAKSVLRVGQTLTIPPGGVAGYQAKAPAVSSSKAKAPSKKANHSRKTETVSAGNGTKYTVASGDSLWKIAAKHKVKSSAIAEANKISLSTQLKVGQVLVIPGKKAASVADVVSETKKAVGTKTSDAAKPAEKEALTTEEKQALEELKTDETKSVDDLLKDIPATETPTTEPAATAAAAPSSPMAGDIVEVTEDTDINAFAQKHKVSADDLKKANPGLPDNGKLSAGMIITLP